MPTATPQSLILQNSISDCGVAVGTGCNFIVFCSLRSLDYKYKLYLIRQFIKQSNLQLIKTDRQTDRQDKHTDRQTDKNCFLLI